MKVDEGTLATTPSTSFNWGEDPSVVLSPAEDAARTIRCFSVTLIRRELRASVSSLKPAAFCIVAVTDDFGGIVGSSERGTSSDSIGTASELRLCSARGVAAPTLSGSPFSSGEVGCAGWVFSGLDGVGLLATSAIPWFASPTDFGLGISLSDERRIRLHRVSFVSWSSCLSAGEGGSRSLIRTTHSERRVYKGHKGPLL